MNNNNESQSAVPEVHVVVQAATPSSAVPAAPDDNRSITVVRDLNHLLGKRFNLDPDGAISKTPSVCLSLGLAVMHHVPTAESFAALLRTVGEDPHAAIINASFKGIEIGEDFAILSEYELEKRLGLPAADRERQKGVHQIEYDGKQLKAVGRFKENVHPSAWQLLDRDIDKHTPTQFSTLTTPEWLTALAAIIPGIDKVTYVETPSTSSRVMRGGDPIGGGNGHVWVYVNDPSGVECTRAALIPRAAQADMTWLKPRFSRKDPGEIVGKSLTTIIDPSVWTPGRLIFVGQPTVGEGLAVMPLSAVVHQGECATLDISAIVLPDAKTIRDVTRKAGVEMTIVAGSSGLTTRVGDLQLATEIESKDHGVLTVREIIERGLTGKLRCQTPFRDSSSYAAFYNTNEDGVPFVYDVGTSTTHWLNEFEVDKVKLVKTNGAFDKLMSKVKEDSSAVLEDDAVGTLAAIKQHKLAEYNRKRAQLKRINPKVPLTDMDRAVKAHIAEAGTAPTHHGFAKSLLSALTVETWQPISYHGTLYTLDPDRNIWACKPSESLERMVAEMHDGPDLCKRSSDYRAIAGHAINLASDCAFFSDAPVGVACPGGFYRIEGSEIVIERLEPHHRQRVLLGFTPEDMPTPMFDAFLHDTFKSENDGEEHEQIALLQEIAGGIMLGINHKYHFAVLFYEPFGRAGKGTLEKQLRELVPKEFVSAISPFKWHSDYHVATLAGKRLNVVGELPETDPIPAAAFKTVIGGDLVTGRHPTHRPITFTNEATHLFMSNHLITTKDQSEAFFARWKIITFPNSRLRSGLPLDENLAQRIIANELPGIGLWALKGAARLLHNGKFSSSTAHDRLMAKWRCTANSLEEFISEACELQLDCQYRRSTFYVDYKEWCSENGRKPFAKGRVKELLEHNVGMGVRLVELNGYETFMGIKSSPAAEGRSPAVPTPDSIGTDLAASAPGHSPNVEAKDAF